MAMKLIVNGKQQEFRDDLTVAEFLIVGKLAHVRVAVEVNGQVVRRQDFEKVKLNDGDSLEVVTLVGGG